MNVNINKENFNSLIASRLRSLRAQANMSQYEVARLLGISQQTYSKYENCDANIDSAAIIKLCDIYGVTADYLLGIEHKTERKGGNVPFVIRLTDEQVALLAKKMSKAKETDRERTSMQ